MFRFVAYLGHENSEVVRTSTNEDWWIDCDPVRVPGVPSRFWAVRLDVRAHRKRAQHVEANAQPRGPLKHPLKKAFLKGHCLRISQ